MQVKAEKCKLKQLRQAVKGKTNGYKYIYIYEQIVHQEDKITRRLLSEHKLPINDAFGLTERGKIHLRIHTGKLSHGILEPLAVSIDNIIV